MATISGGFDQQYFFTDTYKPERTTVQILYAGKLNRTKGVPWLLRCLAKLKYIPFHLHLAGGGSGPENNECLKLAEVLGNKCTVHGVLTHQELGNLMRRSHIFVLPSFFEGLPLVLLEAMACGCQIVTTDLPGVKELFSTQDKEIVHMVELPPLQTIDTPRSEDEPLLEKLLLETLTSCIRDVKEVVKPETALLAELAAPFTWDNIFERIADVYEQAVAGRSERLCSK